MKLRQAKISAMRRTTSFKRGSGSVALVNTLKSLSNGGDVGSYFSTPDSVALSITGDIDIRAKLKPLAWDGSGGWDQSILFKLTGATASYALTLKGTRTLLFNFSLDGSAILGAVSTTTVPLVDGTVGYVRATRASASGVITYYTSTDGSTWNPLGTTLSLATGNLFDGTSLAYVGDVPGLSEPIVQGNLYWVEVRNGINGSVVAKFDPSVVTPGGVRTPTSFVSSTGETWTEAGSATAWDWQAA